METVSVAHAKARLTEILHQVEAGAEIIVTRRGRAVARLAPIARPRTAIDFAALDSLRARQTLARVPSSRLVRKMRDSKY